METAIKGSFTQILLHRGECQLGVSDGFCQYTSWSMYGVSVLWKNPIGCTLQPFRYLHYKAVEWDIVCPIRALTNLKLTILKYSVTLVVSVKQKVHLNN